MKRDRELQLWLLMKLEEWLAQPGDVFLFSGHEPELAIEGYSGEEIEYHLGTLKAEGYIDSPGSQPMQGVTFRSLTAAGHDLVDQYREALEQQAAEKAAEESRRWIAAWPRSDIASIHRLPKRDGIPQQEPSMTNPKPFYRSALLSDLPEAD